MLVRNWREALHIALVPTALWSVALVVAGFALPQLQAAVGEAAARGPMILTGLISILIAVVAMIWMLVNWHRLSSSSRWS
ncbi:hypothetical protein [Roseovarius arcticus]|uniref:hypothetical protein n=1 Tax=Roseovarius arcticus TaxID=2547404 RepID=UPI001110A7D5|nr:hypothetical protein [Roseovarius arcticus]